MVAFLLIATVSPRYCDSIPNIITKGDNWVDRFTAVLCANKAEFISKSQSAASSNNLTKESHKDLLKRSTNPFVWDRYGVDIWCLILNFSVNSLITLFTNSVPLSVCKWLKYPNLQIILLYKKSAIKLASAYWIAWASCHLKRYSTATTIYLFPLGIIGNSPTTSTPYQLNNLEGEIGCNWLQ